MDCCGVVASPYDKTSDVFSPEYKANTSRRIGFSADVATSTSSNIRLYTAFAMHIVEIYPVVLAKDPHHGPPTGGSW